MLEAKQLEMFNTMQREMEEQARSEARCEFSIVIGYSQESEDIGQFEAEIIRTLCLEYQGCSVTRGQGYWLCDDEFNTDNEIFEVANPATERNITINLSVYSDLEEEAYNFIQKQVAFAKNLWDIDVEWIHCTTQTVRARHFQV
jgi:hypothetical protein